MTENLGHKAHASSSTLQSSFVRLQRAFTPTHGQKRNKKNGAQQLSPNDAE
jgi:hypothetical protein